MNMAQMVNKPAFLPSAMPIPQDNSLLMRVLAEKLLKEKQSAIGVPDELLEKGNDMPEAELPERTHEVPQINHEQTGFDLTDEQHQASPMGEGPNLKDLVDASRNREARAYEPGKWDEYFDVNSTGMSSYDNYMKNPQYSEFAKQLKPNKVLMTPDEYFQESSKVHGGRLTPDEEANLPVSDLVEKYLELTKSGSKMPLPVIDKARNLQEGRHRTAVAKRLGLNELPVLELLNGRQKYEIPSNEATFPTYNRDLHINSVKDAILGGYKVPENVLSSLGLNMQDIIKNSRNKMAGDDKKTKDEFKQWLLERMGGAYGPGSSAPPSDSIVKFLENSKFKPKTPIKVYRAVEDDSDDDESKYSSWTRSKAFAKRFGREELGNYKIKERVVLPEEILLDINKLPRSLKRDAFEISEIGGGEREVILKPNKK